MRQLFLASSNILLKDVAQPLLDNDSILVQVLYSYVNSKTEVSSLNNVNSGVLNNIPQKIRKVFEAVCSVAKDGEHSSLMCSCAGRVIAVGKKITTIRPGDFVACSGNSYSHYGDLLLIPYHAVVPLASRDHLKIGSLASIGAGALHSIRRAKLHIGDVVCVYGLGLSGQLVVQLARNAGCTVVGIDSLDSRVASARNNGAFVASTALDDIFEKEVASLTRGQGVDATILALTTEDHCITDHAIKITRKRGKIVLLGDLPMAFNSDLFFSKELEIIAACSRSTVQPVGSYDYDYGDGRYPFSGVSWSHMRNMQTFLDQAIDKKLQLDEILLHETAIDDLDKAYKKVKTNHYFGAVLRYSDGEKAILPDIGQKLQPSLAVPEPKSSESALYIPASTHKLRICIIADRLPDGRISEESFEQVKNSAVVGRYTIKQLLAGNVILSPAETDVIIFDTEQTVPIDLVTEAVLQGIAVFVDGSLCTTFSDYEKLKEIVAQPQAKIGTNFYRSLTVPICHISSVLYKKKGPVALHYRINESVKDTVRKHTAQYSGAVLMRGPALIDLFLLLIAHNPVALSVEAVRSGRDDIFPTDNFSVQISFLDGSICSLLYTTLGNSDVPHERMELFYDGKTIVLDEFHEVYGYGFSNSLTSSYSDDYKTHNLAGTFLRRISMEHYEPVIPYQRLLVAHYLSLVIDELICQGGGNKHVVV